MLVAAQLASAIRTKGESERVRDDGIVTVVDNDSAKSLQPLAPKVEAAPAALGTPESVVATVSYVEVWKRLEALAGAYAARDEAGNVTPEAKAQFVAEFLNGLNYKPEKWNGPIVSQLDGKPISPDAVLCYLNGYVHDKPYLKANCPTY